MKYRHNILPAGLDDDRQRSYPSNRQSVARRTGTGSAAARVGFVPLLSNLKAIRLDNRHRLASVGRGRSRNIWRRR